MPLVSVTTSFSNRVSPGHLDNRERWVAARVSSSHLNIILNLIRNAPPASLKGDEFEAAKHLSSTIQTAVGTFIDALHTASTIDQLIDINNEFYKMAAAKS